MNSSLFNFTPETIVAFGIIFVVAFGMMVGATIIYRKYTGLGTGSAFLLLLIAIFLGIFSNYLVWPGVYYPILRHIEFHSIVWPFRISSHGLIVFMSRIMLAFTIVPFVAKLYQKLIGAKLTEEERAVGAQGFRAWLRGGNLFCCISIPFFAWLGFGYSFLSVLGFMVLAILAYPLVNTITKGNNSATEHYDELSEEREKVLNLLEQGKITSEKCAELLNALGRTTSQSSILPRMDRTRRIILRGALLVVVGCVLTPLARFSHQPGFVQIQGARYEAVVIHRECLATT
jgi:SHOCT-like domain